MAYWTQKGKRFILDASVDVLGQVLLLPSIVLLAALAVLIPAWHAGQTSVVEVLRHEW